MKGLARDRFALKKNKKGMSWGELEKNILSYNKGHLLYLEDASSLEEPDPEASDVEAGESLLVSSIFECCLGAEIDSFNYKITYLCFT